MNNSSWLKFTVRCENTICDGNYSIWSCRLFKMSSCSTLTRTCFGANLSIAIVFKKCSLLYVFNFSGIYLAGGALHVLPQQGETLVVVSIVSISRVVLIVWSIQFVDRWHLSRLFLFYQPVSPFSLFYNALETFVCDEIHQFSFSDGVAVPTVVINTNHLTYFIALFAGYWTQCLRTDDECWPILYQTYRRRE
jgi:hypothetical protein